jgi:hypothetical protein
MVPGFPDFEPMNEPRSPESGTIRKQTAKRRYLGPWSRRWAFVQEVLGRETVITGPPVGITYYKPYQYPDADWLYCTEFEIEGFPDTTGEDARQEIVYPFAMVTLTFENLNFDLDGSEAYRIVNLRTTPEFLTTPDGVYQYSSGNLVLAPVGILIPRIDFSIELPRMARIPDAWFDMAGHTNSTTFLNRAVGTVLYQEAQATITTNALGGDRYGGALAISYRRVPWNQQLNPATGTFQTISTVVGGNPPLPSADLNQLLVP